MLARMFAQPALPCIAPSTPCQRHWDCDAVRPANRLHATIELVFVRRFDLDKHERPSHEAAFGMSVDRKDGKNGIHEKEQRFRTKTPSYEAG